jgi:hypothetical protein
MQMPERAIISVTRHLFLTGHLLWFSSYFRRRLRARGSDAPPLICDICLCNQNADEASEVRPAQIRVLLTGAVVRLQSAGMQRMYRDVLVK